MYTSRSTSNRSLRRRVGIAPRRPPSAWPPRHRPGGRGSGDLDTQFSGDGKQIGADDTQNVTASFLQLDAKLVVAGNGVYDDGTVQKSAPTSPATTRPARSTPATATVA